MPFDVQITTTQAVLPFFMTDSVTHIDGKISLTPVVLLSKNGAAFSTAAGAVAEIANGWYKVAGHATDTNTLGPIALHATAAGADACDSIVACVVAYNPQDSVRLGLTALPNAAAAATSGLATVDGNNAVKVQNGSGANQILFTTGVVQANLVFCAGATVAAGAIPNAAAGASAGLPIGDASGAIKVQSGTGANQINLSSGKVVLQTTGVDAITVESGLNLRQAISLIAAAAAGELSGASTTNIIIKAANDNATTRITATVDGAGNRTAVSPTIPA